MNLTQIINDALGMSASRPADRPTANLVLYSGFPSPNNEGYITNRDAARTLAEEYPNTYYTIFDTDAGRYLQNQLMVLESFGPLSADQLLQIDNAWKTLSLLIVQDATGTVTACVGGNVLVKGTTFADIEYKAVLANSGLTAVNGLLKSSLPVDPAIAIPEFLSPSQTCYSPIDPEKSASTVPYALPSLAYDDSTISDTPAVAATTPSTQVVTIPTPGSQSTTWNSALQFLRNSGVPGAILLTTGAILYETVGAELKLLLSIIPDLGMGTASAAEMTADDIPSQASSYSSNLSDSEGAPEVSEALAIADNLAYIVVEDGIKIGSLSTVDLANFSAAQTNLSYLNSFLGDLSAADSLATFETNGTTTGTISAAADSLGGFAVDITSLDSNGSSLAVTFLTSGAGSGYVSRVDQENSDGKSQITTYTMGGSSYSISYPGTNGTGIATASHIVIADGDTEETSLNTANETVSFSGAEGVLKLDSPNSFISIPYGFSPSNLTLSESKSVGATGILQLSFMTFSVLGDLITNSIVEKFSDGSSKADFISADYADAYFQGELASADVSSEGALVFSGVAFDVDNRLFANLHAGISITSAYANADGSLEIDLSQQIDSKSISFMDELFSPGYSQYSAGLDYLGAFTRVIDFHSGGLDGDILSLDTVNGVPAFDVKIGENSTADIANDYAVAGISDTYTFMSDGTLILDNPGSFFGTIYGFQTGDNIELLGISVANVTIGSGVLNVTEADGVTLLLRLDPSQDYSATHVVVNPNFNVISAVPAAPPSTGPQDVTVLAPITTDGPDDVPITTTYSASVNLSVTDIHFVAERTDNLWFQYVPITITYVDGDLDPNAPIDSVSVSSPSVAGDTSPVAYLTYDPSGSYAPVGPDNLTETLDVTTQTSVGEAAGQIFPVTVSYDNSSTTINLTISRKIYAPATVSYLVDGDHQGNHKGVAVHVGEAASFDVIVSNASTGDLTDTLSTGLNTVGEFTASNAVSDLGPGQSGKVVVTFDAKVAGRATADAALFDPVSHDDDLPDEVAAGSSVVDRGVLIDEDVYNYARPLLAEGTVTTGFSTPTFVPESGLGAGTFTQINDNNYTLDFGTISNDDLSTSYSGNIVVENIALGGSYSDSLGGTAAISGSGFVTSILIALAPMQIPSGSIAEFGYFAPDRTSLGSHTLTVVYQPTSVDREIGSTALPVITLTVTDNIVASDIPGATVTTTSDGVTVGIDTGQDILIDPLFAGLAPIPTLTIQGPGTAEVDEFASVTNLVIAPGGGLFLNGGEIDTDPVTVDANGNITGNGLLTGNVTDAGTITATGGTLELSGNISGAGTLVIDPGSTLLVDGSVAPGVIIEFASGGTGTLQLADPTEMRGTVEGQVAGDEVEDLPCYLQGTCIATPGGEMSVETLVVGDLVLTASGESRRIRWTGHRRLDCRRHPNPENVWPVRIISGAFGAGVPFRNLWLSPSHAVFAEGVLIPVKYLINGTTIVQEPRDELTYWHVELEQHNVILAEGLPCESYLDSGQRSSFANGGGVVRLHPDFSPEQNCEAIWEAAGCAPLRIAGDAVDRAIHLLHDQSVKLGYAPAAQGGTRSPERRPENVSADLTELLRPDWYLTTHPDVAAAGVDPLTHYAVWAGRKEGRLPCSEADLVRELQLLDPVSVAIIMPDVVAAGVDPVEHFCAIGWRERRRPNPYFNTGRYLDTVKVSEHMNPLIHYVLWGEGQGIAPSTHFDPAWYRERYALGPTISPLAHYLQYRHTQRFSPLPTFDVGAYLRAHTILPGRDPYAHYRAIGRFEAAREFEAGGIMAA